MIICLRKLLSIEEELDMLEARWLSDEPSYPPAWHSVTVSTVTEAKTVMARCEQYSHLAIIVGCNAADKKAVIKTIRRKAKAWGYTKVPKPSPEELWW